MQWRDFRALAGFALIVAACNYEPPTTGDDSESSSSGGDNGGAGGAPAASSSSGSSGGSGGTGGAPAGSSSSSSSSSSGGGVSPGLVSCGNGTCEIELGQGCCYTVGAVPSCVEKNICVGQLVKCDEPADCPGKVCCKQQGGSICDSSCAAPTDVVCVEDADCPMPLVCKPPMFGPPIKTCGVASGN